MYHLDLRSKKVNKVLLVLFRYRSNIFDMKDIEKLLKETNKQLTTFVWDWIKDNGILNGLGSLDDEAFKTSIKSNPLLPKMVFDFIQNKHKLELAKRETKRVKDSANKLASFVISDLLKSVRSSLDNSPVTYARQLKNKMYDNRELFKDFAEVPELWSSRFSLTY